MLELFSDKPWRIRYFRECYWSKLIWVWSSIRHKYLHRRLDQIRTGSSCIYSPMLYFLVKHGYLRHSIFRSVWMFHQRFGRHLWHFRSKQVVNSIQLQFQYRNSPSTDFELNDNEEQKLVACIRLENRAIQHRLYNIPIILKKW